MPRRTNASRVALWLTCLPLVHADEPQCTAAQREERALRARTCQDAGPFACTEANCPASELSCADLANMGVGDTSVCTLRFTAVWDGAPPAGTDGFLVSDLCPRACGTCAQQWLQSECEGPGAAPRTNSAVVDATGKEAALQAWLRQTGPEELEAGLCHHTDEQVYVARSSVGGRGVFARRPMAMGEVIHVVRSEHLIGGWVEDDVLSDHAIMQVLRVLRGLGDEARFRAYVELLPRYEDLYALPELWSAKQLSWLQDDLITRLAQSVPATLEASHTRLQAAEAWEPPLRLEEVQWARAILQSRPLALGSGERPADPRLFYLLPFADLLNTQLAPAAEVNAKLQSFRADRLPGRESASTDSVRSKGRQPRALVTTTRAVAAEEELFIDYGLDLRETTVQYALLNYGILGSAGRAQFRPGSLRKAADGELLCEPLWCLQNGPSYAGMTALSHVDHFPERIRQLDEVLQAPPLNRTAVDDDVRELAAARDVLQQHEGMRASYTHANHIHSHDTSLLDARRRVMALEYRLGCKLGFVSAMDAMRDGLNAMRDVAQGSRPARAGRDD